MAATGSFHIRGRLWIHDPDNLTDYLCVYWDDATQALTIPGQVRAYGTGETAVVRSFGATRVHPYRLPALDPTLIRAFEAWAGLYRFFRDSRGNAYHGVYLDTTTAWRRAHVLGDLSITVTEVTAPQLVGVA